MAFPLKLSSHFMAAVKWCKMHKSVARSLTGNVRTRKFHPRRAVMYVPASDRRKLQKIPSLGVDTVVIDCEDGVAINQKELARANIGLGLSLCTNYSECVVRVNDVSSDHFWKDIQSVFVNEANSLPDALMLPKCETIDHLHELDFLVGFYHNSMTKGHIPLHIFIESPSSLLSLKDICHCGIHSLKNLELQVVVFGSDDYIATLGGQRSNTSQEVLHARQHIVATAKSFGLHAIDIVSIDYTDLDALQLESEEAARMGYTGKQIIHPNQIKIVQNAFSPSSKSIEWAEGLIASFNEHEAVGKGAFTYKGKMIDKPLLLQAQNIVNMKNMLSKYM